MALYFWIHLDPSAGPLSTFFWIGSSRDDSRQFLGKCSCLSFLHEGKDPSTCKYLEKVKNQLFTFYEFPEEHCAHVRTTNPIESAFATVRHRTMIYKLVKAAEKGGKRLRGFALLSNIVAEVKFKDGEEVIGKESVA